MLVRARLAVWAECKECWRVVAPKAVHMIPNSCHNWIRFIQYPPFHHTVSCSDDVKLPDCFTDATVRWSITVERLPSDLGANVAAADLSQVIVRNLWTSRGNCFFGRRSKYSPWSLCHYVRTRTVMVDDGDASLWMYRARHPRRQRVVAGLTPVTITTRRYDEIPPRSTVYRRDPILIQRKNIPNELSMNLWI